MYLHTIPHTVLSAKRKKTKAETTTLLSSQIYTPVLVIIAFSYEV